MGFPPQQIQSESKVRLDSVQMLRAIAAIVVVTHHISLFANGEWGVDLFFVISGFIMCYVTAESGSHFFAKRLIRIVPLYWAGTIAVFCVALWMPHLLMHTTTNVVNLVKSLLFIPFKKGHQVMPVLFLGWTLNYEMFFYLVFGISMAVTHEYRAYVASTLLLAIVAAGLLAPSESVPLQFFAEPIILEFAFGMLCYTFLVHAAKHGAQDRPISSRILWVLMGGLLIGCMPFATGLLPFVDRVIRWGILAALSFYFVVYGLWGIKLPRAVVIVGDASYSLYLFHPYILRVFSEIFHAFAGGRIRAYFMSVTAISLCCGISVLSYRYLERPVSEFLRKRFVDRVPRYALNRQVYLDGSR